MLSPILSEARASRSISPDDFGRNVHPREPGHIVSLPRGAVLDDYTFIPLNSVRCVASPLRNLRCTMEGSQQQPVDLTHTEEWILSQYEARCALMRNRLRLRSRTTSDPTSSESKEDPLPPECPNKATKQFEAAPIPRTTDHQPPSPPASPNTQHSTGHSPTTLKPNSTLPIEDDATRSETSASNSRAEADPSSVALPHVEVRHDLAVLVRDTKRRTTYINGVETRVRVQPDKPPPFKSRPRTKMVMKKAKAVHVPKASKAPKTATAPKAVTASEAAIESSERKLLRRTRKKAAPKSTGRSRLTKRSLFHQAPWPSHVAHLQALFNPEEIEFEFEAPFVAFCECAWPCRKGTCPHAILDTFCTDECWEQGLLCGNRLRDNLSAQLVHDETQNTYSVLAASAIDEGVVIGEYLGMLVSHPRPNGPRTQRSRGSGYKLKLKRESSSHPRADIFIDAENCGGVTRFLNHSYLANVRFHEVRNGSTHTVVAITSDAVSAGQELTVNYGDDLWFVCRCGESTCVHRDIQHLNDP